MPRERRFMLSGAVLAAGEPVYNFAEIISLTPKELAEAIKTVTENNPDAVQFTFIVTPKGKQ